MSRRHFVETPVREDGQPVPRYRLVCGTCGCGETLGRQNFGPEIADTQVPKKFEERGWSVGKRRDGRDDRCPSCVNREQERRRNSASHVPRRTNADKQRDVSALLERNAAAAPSERLSAREIARRAGVVPQTVCNLMTTTSVLKEFPLMKPEPNAGEPKPQSAGKPREMTRDERRLIWAKLDEVYVDEKAGYSAGWTDARLAEDLGVPRAWVSTIRDENFGQDQSEELQQTVAEARAVMAANAEHAKAVETLVQQGAALLKRAEAVERSLRRIETAVR